MPARRGIGNWYVAGLEIPPDIADLLRQASTQTGLAMSQLARICIYDKVREILASNRTITEYVNSSPYRGDQNLPVSSPKPT